MSYGLYGAERSAPSAGMQLVYSGSLEGQTTNEIVLLSPSSKYLAFSTEITISTNRYYGSHAWYISTPEADVFESAPINRIAIGAGENSGITSSLAAGGQFVYRCASSSYRVELIIYKIG